MTNGMFDSLWEERNKGVRSACLFHSWPRQAAHIAFVPLDSAQRVLVHKARVHEDAHTCFVHLARSLARATLDAVHPDRHRLCPAMLLRSSHVWPSCRGSLPALRMSVNSQQNQAEPRWLLLQKLFHQLTLPEGEDDDE